MISISIVIPVYNVEKYVERCLNSVENQNYNGKLDCIIVDDCGNDNSMSLVNAFVYSHQNSRINYIILSHTQNRGLSEARNTGIRESTSDYIFFLDSDDEIPYNAMSLLANEVHKHPEIDIVMGFMYSATKNDYYNIEKYRNHQYITDPNWLRYQSFKDGENIQVTACNKLTKKKFITENNLFFYPNIIHEDNLWMFDLLKHIRSFAFVYEPTYIRYINEGSITTSSDKTVENESWKKILFNISLSLNEPFRALKIGRYCHRYFAHNLYLHNQYDKKTIRNFAKASLKCYHIKLCILLTIWYFFPFSHKNRLKNYIQKLSFKIYHSETIKYSSQYSIE